MVKVSHKTTDQIVAWRIRDGLAAHPLLGGATAQIYVIADYEEILLVGWAVDEGVIQLALRLARRVAGKRAVCADLQICRQAANKVLTECKLDDNRLHTLI